ncbi:MAG: hypothetical protein M3548_02180 [Actinomycetota bacterium]|nr:hypothetical protein [Actinomycetota bacterium]
MDFWKTLLVLLKRWYVTLPVFVVSVGAAGAVYASMPMHYESTGVIVLTSPSSGPTSNTAQLGDVQTNPLLAFESSLAISASIVIQSINTPEVVKELVGDKPDHVFVLSGGAEGGPFISVATESASEEGSRELVVQVLDRVKAELSKRQEELKAPASTFIGVDDVVPPTEPQPLVGGKLRAGGIALVLGLVASLTAVFAFESFKSRRRKQDPPQDKPDDLDGEGEAKPVARPATRQAPARVEQPVRTSGELPIAPPLRTPADNPNPVRANGQRGGKAPTGSGMVNGKNANAQASWPAEEWHEPPTVRMKPAQTPPDQRG